jgi:hypothetical protein
MKTARSLFTPAPWRSAASRDFRLGQDRIPVQEEDCPGGVCAPPTTPTGQAALDQAILALKARGPAIEERIRKEVPEPVQQGFLEQLGLCMGFLEEASDQPTFLYAQACLSEVERGIADPLKARFTPPGEPGGPFQVSTGTALLVAGGVLFGVLGLYALAR